MPELNVGRKQGILLVLVLLLLGGATDCLLGQAATAPRRHVMDVCASYGYGRPGRPGASARASVSVSWELPAGEAEGVLTVFVGEGGRKLPARTSKDRKGGYSETPLYMEKRRYVLKAASGNSWTAEMYCPPLLRELRSVGAPDRIRLMWEGSDTTGGAWTKEPQIVIFRSDLKEAKEVGNPGSVRLYYAPFKEVGRVQATASEYEDRAVVPGETYVYRVAVEVEAEVSLTRSDTGATETVSRMVRGVAPVHNAVCGVVATAESPKPLRVAAVVGTAPTIEYRLSCSLAAQMVRDALPALPWVLATVRDDPQAVTSEKAVAGMGQDERGVSAFDLLPAEACLRVDVPRFLVDEAQVWLEDYLNGRHVLLARAPISRPERLLKQIHEALPKYFPERVGLRVGEEKEKTDEKRPRLAVLALRPAPGVSAIQLSRASLRSLVASELASSFRFEVVDREWTDAAFAEQERLALKGGDGMAELGHTLGADYLLSGTYEVQENELVLAAYLVDVAHGVKSNRVICRGRVGDIGGIARQLETELLLPRPFAELGSAMPLRLAFELDRSLGHADYRDRIDVATLGRSRDHREVLMAVGRMAETDLHQARMFLQRVLDGEDRSDPHRLLGVVCRLDALLRATGEDQERVRLWRRAMMDVPDGKVWTDLGLHVFFSEALCDAGEAEEAKKWVRPGPGSVRHVLLYEKLGLRQDAWEECLRARWLEEDRPGPGYAGAVFLLHGASKAERHMILGEIGRRLSGAWPYQVKRALVELERDGAFPDDLWGVSLCNAVRLGDGPRREIALANLHRLPDCDRISSLSCAMSRAAKQGEGAVAEGMMSRIRAMRSGDTRTRKIRDACLVEGIPEIKAARVPFVVSRSQMVDTLAANRWNGKRVDDTVYLLSDAEVLVAYDRKEKEILWQLDLTPLVAVHQGARENASRTVGDRRLSSVLAQEAEILYVPVCREGRLLGVDCRDGSIRWSYTAWGRISSPTVSEDGERVVLTDAPGAFVVLDARSGKLLRRMPLRNLVGWARDRNGMLQTRCLTLDEQYQVGMATWVRAVPANSGYLSLYRHLPPSMRRGQYANLDPRGMASYSYSLNTETLGCVEGMPPLPEPKERLFAAMSDRTLPERQRVKRLSVAGRVFPMEILQPVLVGIAQNRGETMRVRSGALKALAKVDPSKGVLAMAEILNTPENRTEKIRGPSCWPPERGSARLNDEAVQAVARLAEHPSPWLQYAAARTLVCAMGQATPSHIKRLLMASPYSYGPNTSNQARMAHMMARRGMPEAMVLLRPLLELTVGNDPYAQVRSNGPLLIIARNGNKEAQRLVVVPFDEKAHLTLLRKATSPLLKNEIRDLARPYRWVAEYFPMPRFLPFIRESLEIAPVEIRMHVVNAYFRVASTEALPIFVRQAMEEQVRRGNALPHFVAWGVCRLAIEAVTGIDLGNDLAAWEQEVRRRARRENAAGGE